MLRNGKNKPKISIIVPVYNVEQYLEECLHSLIQQTLIEIEIICVDDCSSDNSGNIIDSYEKKLRDKLCEKKWGYASTRQLYYVL